MCGTRAPNTQSRHSDGARVHARLATPPCSCRDGLSASKSMFRCGRSLRGSGGTLRKARPVLHPNGCAPIQPYSPLMQPISMQLAPMQPALLQPASMRRHAACHATGGGPHPAAGGSDFDLEAFEEQRLGLDAKARDDMIAKAKAESAQEEELPGSEAGAWKWEIRKRIWDYMEEHNVAEFPRPVHHRIPNFKNAELAAQRLSQLPEFQQAKTVKVNPDTPQKLVRHAVLKAGKSLLVPQPRLRTGFFSELTRGTVPADSLMHACTSAGVAKYGSPLSLDARFKVDLIVVGSSAVDLNGSRLGKGEGFAELEYGMLRWMGAVDDATLVVTTVHDCQVLETPIDAARMLEHDVPVDLIVTPTRVIKTSPQIKKPPGILWHRLSPEKLAQIGVLQELKARIEEETGQQLPSGPPEKLPPLAERNGRGGGQGGGRRGGRRGANGRRGGGRARGGGETQAEKPAARLSAQLR